MLQRRFVGKSFSALEASMKRTLADGCQLRTTLHYTWLGRNYACCRIPVMSAVFPPRKWSDCEDDAAEGAVLNEASFVAVSGYFEITSVAPNLNRILPLRFDFKDCLNASLNWSSVYTCSTAAESDPSATRSPSFW
jgi:hypothetical protein